MKEIRIKGVELDFTNQFLPEHTNVIVPATIIIEIDDEGEKTVVGAIAEKSNEIFGVKAGDWFDPQDSIDIQYLEEEIKESLGE